MDLVPPSTCSIPKLPLEHDALDLCATVLSIIPASLPSMQEECEVLCTRLTIMATWPTLEQDLVMGSCFDFFLCVYEGGHIWTGDFKFQLKSNISCGSSVEEDIYILDVLCLISRPGQVARFASAKHVHLVAFNRTSRSPGGSLSIVGQSVPTFPQALAILGPSEACYEVLTTLKCSIINCSFSLLALSDLDHCFCLFVRSFVCLFIRSFVVCLFVHLFSFV